MDTKDKKLKSFITNRSTFHLNKERAMLLASICDYYGESFKPCIILGLAIDIGLSQLIRQQKTKEQNGKE